MDNFFIAIENYGILQGKMVRFFGWLNVTLEILISMLLLIGVYLHISFILIFTLLLIYTTAITVNVY